MALSSSSVVTVNKFAKIPHTNFTVQFVIDQLNSAGAKCPKIWQIYAKNLDPNVAVDSLSGTGFLSAITRITFSFTNSSQQFSTIMKVPTAAIIERRCQQIANEEMQRISAMIGTYHSVELAFYTQIVPKYFRAVPKLDELIAQIYAYSDTFILMEDLGPKGAHRNGAMGETEQKMVESVVEAMALLHAHSLAIPKHVLELLFEPQTTIQSEYLPNSVVQQRICSMPAPMGPYFRKHSDKLAKFLQSTKSGPKIEREIARQLGIDVPVLCHGDLWVNNLLFDRSDGRIRGILDWQFAHFAFSGNGISDIAHFLLSGVNAELRQRFTARWLQLYHRTFVTYSNRWFGLVSVGRRQLVPTCSKWDQMAANGRFRAHSSGLDQWHVEAAFDQSASDHRCMPSKLRRLKDDQIFCSDHCRGQTYSYQPDSDHHNLLAGSNPSNSNQCLVLHVPDRSDSDQRHELSYFNQPDSDQRCMLPDLIQFESTDLCRGKAESDQLLTADGDDCVGITLQQVQTLYTAVFPCRLHSEISIEALLHGMAERDGAEGAVANSLAQLIWQRICAAFDQMQENF